MKISSEFIPNADPLIMAEVASNPGQLTPLDIYEYLGLSNGYAYKRIRELERQGTLMRTPIHTPRGRRTSALWPTDKFWSRFTKITDRLPAKLPRKLQIIHNSAVDGRRNMTEAVDDDLPRLEALKSEVAYLGGVAVLGGCFDLSSIGEWWDGPEGWQALVRIEALDEIDMTVPE